MAECLLAKASCLRYYLPESVYFDPNIVCKDVEPLDYGAYQMIASMCTIALMHDRASDFNIKQ